MTIITLTTDFGIHDGFTGTLKGVIWSICPSAQIADISHSISPQNVLEGAVALWRAYLFFPAGTIHVAVVDPGVGTSRIPMAGRVGDYFFVGPDNGIFSLVYADAKKKGWTTEIVQLKKPRYFLPSVSRTFHGRDIFAPVAAHLANGTPLADLGPVLPKPVWLELPVAEKTPEGWRAHVINVDTFGNLTTDLPAEALVAHGRVIFRLRGHEVHGLAESYGSCSAGELIALVDSENRLELAVVNGSAAALTGANVGDVVEVIE
jgi:S-adenosylmethionine hydrolase